MATKTLNTRIQLKNDTDANWTTAGENNFIPKAGEICVYNTSKKIKVGDGTTNINSLVFEGSVSPNFSGNPTAPTATRGTNTTQIATTAYVMDVRQEIADAITGGAW